MNYPWVNEKALEFTQTYNPKGLVPFPFDDVATSLGDVELVFLDSISDNLSGAIFCQDDKFKIVINAKKPNVRQYFTMAHEFGHYYLHKEWLKEHAEEGFIDFVNFLDGDSALFMPDTPVLTSKEAITREREANNFAAEVLMPAAKVREFWEVSSNIEKCAEVFLVSNSDMAMRLEKLGLS